MEYETTVYSVRSIFWYISYNELNRGFTLPRGMISSLHHEIFRDFINQQEILTLRWTGGFNKSFHVSPPLRSFVNTRQKIIKYRVLSWSWRASRAMLRSLPTNESRILALESRASIFIQFSSSRSFVLEDIFFPFFIIIVYCFGISIFPTMFAWNTNLNQAKKLATIWVGSRLKKKIVSVTIMVNNGFNNVI